MRWVWLVLASAAGHALAQEAGPVLKNSQVDESTLIDALEIDPPDETASGPRTRGFRPMRRPADKPPSSGRASLLITFTTASTQLMPESKLALDTVARAMNSERLASFAFRIEGHADPRGSAEQNMLLSWQRAQAVVEYLVHEKGIEPRRLAPLGKGSTEPIDPLRPELPINRRVTIVTQVKQ